MTRILLIITLFFTPFFVSADVILTAIDELPKEAQEFIKANFSEEKILIMKLDKELFASDTYEVKFASGTEIEFSKEGVWKKVDTKNAIVPDSVIPSKILSHIKENFKEQKIESISKKRYGYKVEFQSGLEVKFNKDFRFIGIDD